MSEERAIEAVLIAGPTASGKSRAALELAAQTGGVIVNADSMQVYRDLRVLTARPTLEDETLLPHALYGHRDAAQNCSVGSWLSDASNALEEARLARTLPIFVGGSGLYFKALLHGLSSVPPTPDAVRESVRARMERDGVEALHAELVRVDPASAERLKPRDTTRVTRALEVFEATGRTLPEWQREGTPPLLNANKVAAVFLDADRGALYARIDARFVTMIAAGALDEVRALASRGLDPLLPAMKAHGVPALIRHLDGALSLDEAIAIGQIDTRRYAKRQFTWFRHQLPAFAWVKLEDAMAHLQQALSI